MTLFYNDEHRLRSGWRFVIYFVATFIAASAAFAVVAVIAALIWGNDGSQQFFTGASGSIIQGAILVISAFLVGCGCVAVFEHLTARSLGWAFHRGWLRDLLLGSVFGALTLLFAALIAGVIGGYKFEFSPNTTAALRSAGVALVIFVLAAAGEEAVFRGYGLQTLTRANLPALGLFLTSVPFALVHLSNPNVSLWFTITNTILAGLWLGVAYLKTRSLWFALGLHWSWNWTMGAVLGIPVSGVTKITPEPLMHVRYSGPGWLNGGGYGLEGGLACTIAVLIATVVVWRMPFPAPSEEMLAASPDENGPDKVWKAPQTGIF